VNDLDDLDSLLERPVIDDILSDDEATNILTQRCLGRCNPRFRPDRAVRQANESCRALFAPLSKPLSPTSHNVIHIKRRSLASIKLFNSDTDVLSEGFQLTFSLLKQPQCLDNYLFFRIDSTACDNATDELF
jgi:hypothetical protein